MARIQILELPEGSSDDRPPFVLVVDESVPQRYILGPDDNPYRDYWQDIAQQIGARGVIVTPETIDIPANDHTAYLGEAVIDDGSGSPDFTSPIAGRVEVRRHCPHCDDQQMIPRTQFAEHVARLHPDADA